MRYIASCSFGKDSIAAILLAIRHKAPLDEAVYCEVMFDKDISGEIPEHRAFIYGKHGGKGTGASRRTDVCGSVYRKDYPWAKERAAARVPDLWEMRCPAGLQAETDHTVPKEPPG